MTRAAVGAVTGAVLLAVAIGLAIVRHGTGGGVATGSFGRDVRAPAGTRIKVEVLNATRTRGLGRRATRVLRDRGFDVVGFGTDATLRDSTLVLDRSGHPDWARRVGEALGGGRVELRADSSRYVDVTVFVGAAWRPPTEPFYP